MPSLFTHSEAERILQKLLATGGALVPAERCTPVEIIDATARGDFFPAMTRDAFVLRPREWAARDERLHSVAPASAE